MELTELAFCPVMAIAAVSVVAAAVVVMRD